MEQFKDLNRGSLVHCITNYVTVNDVANAILASGGSPIMADAIEEVSDITSICNSLVLNIGTLNSRIIDSMIKAGKTANSLNKPVILDPVGVGASRYRGDSVKKLLNKINFSVIRGNATEIKSILMGNKTDSGVDASVDDIISEENLEIYIDIAKEVSAIYKAIVVITGPIDIITGKKITYIVKNGHENMEKITGTGCMLAGLIGSITGANSQDILRSTVFAVGMMGLCGELANEKITKENLGTGSLGTFILDNISRFEKDNLMEKLKIEIK